ncbi:Sorting nexin-14 [Hondaea fermentalgiana]|uniref:Sorting nexin-14 n=1 Tax=Hondaea fermentalgiana TaxID=2315210 RepID=A0A2R5G9S5_9STRA|nr:Sorting nexin-14 [Hondaea fermentalgiana]|eukprot:GBG27806.1 Sorting nexin-14 [Hondaea fermentalgiana]
MEAAAAVAAAAEGGPPHGVAWDAANALGFLAVAFLVYHVARVAQSKFAEAYPNAAKNSPRARRRSYRGGVDGVRANAEWVVGELLTPGKIALREGDQGLPPEWERLYPRRAVAHDFDHAGTTVKLSTADMISIRWDLPLNVSLELGIFADLIVRDFILFWYNESISEEPQFPDDVRSVLQSVFGRLGDRILSINLPMFLLCDISYVLRHHLRWFSELKKRARKRCHPESEFDAIAQEDRNKLVMEEFRRAGHLHPACSITGESNDPRTMSYVRSITSELLVRLLPEADYQCAALRHLLREVLTCNILVPTLESVTPDVLNSVILQLLRGELDADEEEQDPPESSDTVMSTESSQTTFQRPDDLPNVSSLTETSVSVTSPASPALGPRDVRSVSNLSAADIGQASEHQSIDFIHEANAVMKQEEASRLLIDLQGALSDCVSQFTENADTPLGNEHGTARRLIEVLDALLAHGLQPLRLSDDRASTFVVEPWWEYVREVSDAVPSTSMSTNAVDSVVDALVLQADEELNNGSHVEGGLGANADADALAGAGSMGASESASAEGSPDLNIRGDESPQPSMASRSAADSPARRRGLASPAKSSSKGYSKEILAPGRAWLAMMLKHKLLAEGLQALLQNKTRTDSHYIKSAAIRAERLVPTLATLNGVDFDFDLNRFWKNASKVRTKLEKKGIKTTKQERLRRLRQRVRTKLVKRLKSHGSSVPDQAIIALQDRVGAIRSSISGFTMKNKGRSSYVQYVLSLSLTRRVDGGVASWTVFRRYSKFSELHHTLRTRYGYQFDDVSMPKKGSLFSSQNMSFINTRKEELAVYLEKLLTHPVVCDSEELLTFLSPQTPEDLDESSGSIHSASAPDAGEPASPIPPRLSVNNETLPPGLEATQLGLPRAEESAPSQPAATRKGAQGAQGTNGRLTVSAESTGKNSLSSSVPSSAATTPSPTAPKSRGGTTPPSSARKPASTKKRQRRGTEVKIDASELQMAEDHMYKLAQEIFEFHELSMLRRNLISITRSVVSLVFQGTAQRWLRDNYTRDASAKLLSKLLVTVRELLWPNGKFAEADEDEEKDPNDEKAREEARLNEQHRVEALEEILGHIPQPMSKFLGKDKAHRCARKLHEFLQHPTLIHNLLFTTMDLLLLRIFPDLPLKDLHHKLQ